MLRPRTYQSSYFKQYLSNSVCKHDWLKYLTIYMFLLRCGLCVLTSGIKFILNELNCLKELKRIWVILAIMCDDSSMIKIAQNMVNYEHTSTFHIRRKLFTDFFFLVFLWVVSSYTICFMVFLFQKTTMNWYQAPEHSWAGMFTRCLFFGGGWWWFCWFVLGFVCFDFSFFFFGREPQHLLTIKYY